MIRMTSQLVPPQGAGANALMMAGQKLPNAIVSGNTSRQDAILETQGGLGVPSREELTGAINQLNGYLEETHRGLRFSIDDDSGRTVVKVVDTETDEVIRQIPSEEMLAVIRHFSEMTGKLFDEVA